ncbi:hypothetical protein PYCC9005_001975 [Savitreella phatthalungensis]
MLESVFGTSKPSTTATAAEMEAARLPLGWRDNCAGLLIPLNRCRNENFYMPFRCVDERHSYEKCQYDDFKRRVKEFEKQQQEQA